MSSKLFRSEGFNEHFRKHFFYNIDQKTILSPRYRLFLKGLPLGKLEAAKAFEMRCVACNEPINPFRHTKKISAKSRKNGLATQIHVAVSCEATKTSKKNSCRNSIKATKEYQAIAEELGLPGPSDAISKKELASFLGCPDRDTTCYKKLRKLVDAPSYGFALPSPVTEA